MGLAVGLFSIIFIGILAFWIWALVDCIKVPDDSMYQAGNKLIWVLVIVFLHVIGAIIYLVAGRPVGGANAVGPAGPVPPPPPPPA
jgi:hypothetical protein